MSACDPLFLMAFLLIAIGGGDPVTGWVRAMLARLGKGEATVGELAQPLDTSLPAVAKHLKVIQRAG